MTLKRSAEAQGTSAFNIDELTYVYENSNKSNRLLSVTDSSTDYRGYPDTSGNAISYDDNGNMLSHNDKGLILIDYNFLNLPSYIYRQGLSTRQGIIRNNTSYLYRSDGLKVRKIYRFAPYNPLGTATELSTEQTDYLDGFQYKTGLFKSPGPKGGSGNMVTTLEFYPTAEGYFDFVKNKYIYNYADHLGNVRLSYFNNGSSIEVLEENNYYPFGLKHEGYNPTAGNPAYQYKYNGKELQAESGMYDYGARFYMPDIGRWGVVDPLAETSRRWSTYNYAYNNPIRFIDPDGRTGQDWFWNSINKTFTYDASLNSAEQFKTLQDQGLVQGKYLGKNGNFNVVLGDETIGKVSLQSDGSWTNMSDANQSNWEYHAVGDDDRTRSQYFTSIDSSRNWGVEILDKPFTVGISGEATVGAGGGFEIGYFSGNYDSGIYLNLYKSAGLSAGFGGAYNEYTTQNGYAPLTTANFSGNYWNLQGGVGPISGNYGQTAKDADGRNVLMGGASVSSGIWNFVKRPKLSIGGSAQAGTTYINPSKRIRESER